jgi:hypothetical protein
MSIEKYKLEKPNWLDSSIVHIGVFTNTSPSNYIGLIDINVYATNFRCSSLPVSSGDGLFHGITCKKNEPKLNEITQNDIEWAIEAFSDIVDKYHDLMYNEPDIDDYRDYGITSEHLNCPVCNDILSFTHNEVELDDGCEVVNDVECDNCGAKLSIQSTLQVSSNIHTLEFGGKKYENKG